MSAVDLTKHAVLRMSQRATRLDDLELVEFFGTEVEGGRLVLQRDAQAVEHEAKRLIARVCRLVGKRVVTDGNTIVTVYHASRGKERRLLRGADDRSLRR